MKKLSFYLIIFVLLFYSVTYAQQPDQKRTRNNIKIFSGVTIHGNAGTCTYVIDLKSPQYWPITYGNFSLQFSGVTCAWVVSGSVSPMGGATINAAYRMSNRPVTGFNLSNFRGMLTGSSTISANLESVDIITDLAHDTGNTDYNYEFFPEKCRYLIIDITSGETSMKTSVYIDMD